MLLSRGLPVVAVAVLASAGCFAPGGDEGDPGATSDAALSSAAARDFDDAMQTLAGLADTCGASRRCPTPASPGALVEANVHPLWTTAAATTLISTSMCDAARPLARLQSPYFFTGMAAKAAAIVTLDSGGFDLVWDLRNRQVAYFRYRQTGYEALVGVEASAYAGYGFGKKANVLEAWSGDFVSAEASVAVSFLKIPVGGTVFATPDGSLWGALASVSPGINLIPAGIVPQVGVSQGKWTPWDSATRGILDRFHLVAVEERSTFVQGAPHVYLQLQGPVDLALALVETLGPSGFLPAAQAVALAALDKRGLSIDRACPPPRP